MSKRGQEQSVGEGSAVGTPKPLSPALEKTKPRVLVSQASHNSSRWGEGSDTDTALSNPESPGRAVTMQTGVTQSFRQRTATESDTTDNVRHSQVKTQENVQSPESRKQDGVFFFQRQFLTTDSEIGKCGRCQNGIVQYEDYRYQSCLENFSILDKKVGSSRRTGIICD